MDLLPEKNKSRLPEMVFIIGMGRSGTTLLTNMLNSHPQIVATPENEFVLNLKTQFQHKNFNDTKTVEQFIALLDIKHGKAFSFWKPTANLFNAICKLPNEDKSYATICKLVYLHYPFLEKKEAIQIIVDKNPIYSLHINELKSLFPSAKFIVLTRDYRDNIVSRRKYAESNSSLFSLAASWNYYYKAIERQRKLNPSDFMLLRYEDLVTAPAKELEQLCHFINVEYVEEMLQFQDLSKKIKAHLKETASTKDFEKIAVMHQNLEKEVTINRVNTYREALSESEILLLDNCCATIGKQFQYLPMQPKFNQMSLINRLKYASAQLKVSVFFSLKPLVNQLIVKRKKN